MKILIVDDNIAIQEIIGEILSSDGFDIDKTSTVSEAIVKLRSFHPDIILLAFEVGGENGLRVLDSLPKNSDVKVVILSKEKELVPDNIPFIKGSIQKPFKSSEIIQLVRNISKDTGDKSNKDKNLITRLFFKPRQASADNISGAKFGKSYIIFEEEPVSVYKLAQYFAVKDYDVMVITVGKIRQINKKLKNDDGKAMSVLGLSVKSRIGYIGTSKLGTVMDCIKRFIEEKSKPVIVFDNMGPIIDINGSNSVITMIHQILSDLAEKTSTLIISINENSLTDKDKELLLCDMERYMV